MRIEHDLIGEMSIEQDAYYGIHTARALENFNLSGVPIHNALVEAMVIVKKAAAIANRKIGDLEPSIADAIITACNEILSGNLREQFLVDSLQGGAGTSTNMNVNEVIANRAIEHLCGEKGDYTMVHPLDHVNLHQSTNDVVPTALRIAVIRLIKSVTERLDLLKLALEEKADEFASINKIGRTQLQDAVPVTLGQEFGSWTQAINRDYHRLYDVQEQLCLVNIGGTAVGSSINAPKEYRLTIIKELRDLTGISITQAENLIDLTQNEDVFVEVSGNLKAAAVNLTKIANDMRLLTSGPNSGIGEIILPAVQAGSSIMPGKINPVICEAVNQAAFQIVADDMAITLAAQAGQLELNAFVPIIGKNLLEMLDILGAALLLFANRCVKGIKANEKRCSRNFKGSWSQSTLLAGYLGYEKASKIASTSLETGKSVYEIVREMNLMDEDMLNEVLGQND